MAQGPRRSAGAFAAWPAQPRRDGRRWPGMAYRLKHGDPGVGDGVRRIAREQIDGALSALDAAADDPAEAIHDARKRCKKLRSLARLVRPAFPRYAEENAAIHDAAAALSETRDAEAMIESYDALCEECAAMIDRRDVAAIRRRLTAEKKRAYAGDALSERLDAFRDAMEAARARTGAWRLTTEGFDAVQGGVAKTYKRARKAMRAARERPTDAAMHEWRKRVKHHRNHARLLRGVWKAELGARDAEADRLGDILGDHHDLAVLRARVERDREEIARGADAEGFLRLARLRQESLTAEAFALGARLFAEKPKALTARLGAYWTVWEGESRGRAPEAA